MWTSSRDSLADDKTVLEDVSGGLDMFKVGKFQMASRAYCGSLQLQGQRPAEDVRHLSGGERGRLHLAKTLMQGGNVLLLDEPSNDLDVETLRALEDALLEFAGTVHGDLATTAGSSTASPPTSSPTRATARVYFFDGNYQEYEAEQEAPGRGGHPPSCTGSLQTA